jgi:hypothetical protein
MRRGGGRGRGRPPPGPLAARAKRGEGGWPASERDGSAAFTCVVVSRAVSSVSPSRFDPSTDRWDPS